MRVATQPIGPMVKGMKSKEALSEAWRHEAEDMLLQGRESAVRHCVTLAMGCPPEHRADVEGHRAAAVKLLWRGARAGEAATTVLRLPYDGVSPEEEQKLLATFGPAAADAWWETAEVAHHKYRMARLLLGEAAARRSTPRFTVNGGASSPPLPSWGDPITDKSSTPPKRQPPIQWKYIAGVIQANLGGEVRVTGSAKTPSGMAFVRRPANNWQAHVRSEDCPETMWILARGFGTTEENLRWLAKVYRAQERERELELRNRLREAILNPPPAETFEQWRARTNLAAMTAEEIVYASNMGFLLGFPLGSCSVMRSSTGTVVFDVPPEAIRAPAGPAPISDPPISESARHNDFAAREDRCAAEAEALWNGSTSMAPPTDADMAEIAKNQHLAEHAMKLAREALDRSAPPRYPRLR